MDEALRKKIGERISKARGNWAKRHEKKEELTQDKLGEKLGLSAQAVSSWERGEFVPDTDHLLPLADALDLSLNGLLAEEAPDWELKAVNDNPEHMYTFVKGRAQTKNLPQTLAALPVMREKHRKIIRGKEQRRKSRYGFGAPYEVHPLTLACHALAMGIEDDSVLAACLLHDVIEDTETTPEELKELIPALSDEALEAVKLVSKNLCDKSLKDWEKKYFENIRKNPLACLIKCLDRVNNLSGMADGFEREGMIRYTEETEREYPALLDVLKNTPEYNNAWWLLRYQMRSLTETFKRLL